MYDIEFCIVIHKLYNVHNLVFHTMSSLILIIYIHILLHLSCVLPSIVYVTCIVLLKNCLNYGYFENYKIYIYIYKLANDVRVIMVYHVISKLCCNYTCSLHHSWFLIFTFLKKMWSITIIRSCLNKNLKCTVLHIFWHLWRRQHYPLCNCTFVHVNKAMFDKNF